MTDLVRVELVADCAGERLDQFLSRRFKRLSRTQVQEIIRAAGIERGDGVRLKASSRLRTGDVVCWWREALDEPPVDRRLEQLYRDPALIVFNKPPNLPVHPTARYHHHTVTALLREQGLAYRIAHRLDRETSGCLLAGAPGPAERTLKLAFQNRQVKKLYLAWTDGVPVAQRIDLPLGPARDSRVRVRMGVVAGGAPAVTDIAVLQVAGSQALVVASPLTGRQHQVRAHLAAIGTPIVGDKIYGRDEGLFLRFVEEGDSPELAALAGLGRQALHAWQVELLHPLDGRVMRATAGLPDDLCTGLATAGFDLHDLDHSEVVFYKAGTPHPGGSTPR